MLKIINVYKNSTYYKNFSKRKLSSSNIELSQPTAQKQKHKKKKIEEAVNVKDIPKNEETILKESAMLNDETMQNIDLNIKNKDIWLKIREEQEKRKEDFRK